MMLALRSGELERRSARVSELFQTQFPQSHRVMPANTPSSTHILICVLDGVLAVSAARSNLKINNTKKARFST
jgi:hypothetical protein